MSWLHKIRGLREQKELEGQQDDLSKDAMRSEEEKTSEKDSIISVDPRVMQSFLYQLLLGGFPFTKNEEKLIRQAYYQKTTNPFPLQLQVALEQRGSDILRSVMVSPKQKRKQSWCFPNRSSVSVHPRIKAGRRSFESSIAPELLGFGVAYLDVEIFLGSFQLMVDPCALLLFNPQHPFLKKIQNDIIFSALQLDIRTGGTENLQKIEGCSLLDQLRLSKAAIILENEIWGIQQLMQVTASLATEPITEAQKFEILLVLAEMKYLFWNALEPAREAMELAYDSVQTYREYLKMALVEWNCFASQELSQEALLRAYSFARNPEEKVHVAAVATGLFPQNSMDWIAEMKKELVNLGFQQEMELLYVAYQHFGKHDVIQQWCMEFEGRIDNSRKMKQASDFWKGIGHIRRGEYWRKKRQRILEKTVCQQEKILANLGVTLPFSMLQLDEDRLDSLKLQVQEQLKLADLAKKINSQRQKIGLSAYEFCKAYLRNEIEEQQRFLQEQLGLKKRIQQLQHRLDAIKWNFILPAPPWNKAHIMRLEKRMGVQEKYAQSIEVLAQLIQKAELDVVLPAYPLTEARLSKLKEEIIRSSSSYSRISWSGMYIGFCCVLSKPISWFQSLIGRDISPWISNLHRRREHIHQLQKWRNQACTYEAIAEEPDTTNR